VFFRDIDITRDATAEYLQSLPMGSPDNRMGNDPINTPASGLPNLWLNVGAVNAMKQSGDRYTSGACGAGGVPDGDVTGCTSDANTGANSEYDVDGHFFSVNVDAVTAGQNLQIQVYDPAWTYQGDSCEQNVMTDTQIAALRDLPETTMQDAVARFGPGEPLDGASTKTKYCAGDQSLAYDGATGNMAATSYIVRGPDNTPFNSRDNPVISGCTRTFTGRNITATGIYDRLRETTAYDQQTVAEQGFEQVPFKQHFRQWFTLCTIPAANVTANTRYIVQVRSNPNTSNLPTSAQTASTTPSGGHNRFSLRAGFGATTTPPTNPSTTGIGVYGEGRLPIFVNATAQATTSFYLARITEEYAGEVIVLNFFDIGDVGEGGSVNFSLSPTTDVTSGAFTGCTVIRDGVPTYTPPAAGCGVNGMTSARYQGRAVSVQIPIPTAYNCDEASRTGCWIKINMTFSGSASPNDTTTWSAAVLGDPVRLTE
jgi:hypothetical protein